MRRFYLLVILISFLIILSIQNTKYIVRGNIILQKGNFLSKEENMYNEFPIMTVVAIRGKVERPNKDNKLHLEKINNSILTTRTNEIGDFEFKLRSGIYTFLILKTDGIYLNNFDGKGYFKSYNIIKDTNQIFLLEDSQMLY
tara:strand:- start:56 stop:481 length:426 start_codon:yes stop_codon:yes gene_type:complete